MHAEWFLIQYTADLRKHEPRNVGIALTAGDEWHLRFRGEDHNGKIHGHQIRGLGLSKDIYASWVDYFRRKARSNQWQTAMTLQSRKPSNFSVVSGGIILEQQGRWEFEASKLFTELVPQPERSANSTLDLAHAVFRTAGIDPAENVILPGRWEPDGAQVDIEFNFGLGKQSLMPLEAVSPTVGSIMRFKAQIDAITRVATPKVIIAMMPLSRIDRDRHDELLRPVERSAHVLDLDRSDASEELLAVISA